MTEKQFMQDLFTRSVTHVVRQGRPALDEDYPLHNCRYRQPADDGTVLMCAVGCLLPDEQYSEGIEGTAVDDSTILMHRLRAAFPDADDFIACGTATLRMLKLLQKAHDETGLSCTDPIDYPTFVEEFKQRAKGIALMFDLTMPAFEGEKQ